MPSIPTPEQCIEIMGQLYQYASDPNNVTNIVLKMINPNDHVNCAFGDDPSPPPPPPAKSNSIKAYNDVLLGLNGGLFGLLLLSIAVQFCQQKTFKSVTSKVAKYQWALLGISFLLSVFNTGYAFGQGDNIKGGFIVSTALNLGFTTFILGAIFESIRLRAIASREERKDYNNGVQAGRAEVTANHQAAAARQRTEEKAAAEQAAAANARELPKIVDIMPAATGGGVADDDRSVAPTTVRSGGSTASAAHRALSVAGSGRGRGGSRTGRSHVSDRTPLLINGPAVRGGRGGSHR